MTKERDGGRRLIKCVGMKFVLLPHHILTIDFWLENFVDFWLFVKKQEKSFGS